MGERSKPAAESGSQNSRGYFEHPLGGPKGERQGRRE